MPWKSRSARAAVTELVAKTRPAPSVPTPFANGGSPSGRQGPQNPCFDAGPARKRQRLAEVDALDALVGPCSETRAEHLERHDAGRKTCPRCRYYLFGDAWTATYGSFATKSGGSTRGRSIWLDERPARWGGPWRLGCSLCANFECKRPRDASTLAGAEPSAKRGTRKRGTCGVRGGTKFARYEVCHVHMGASHVRDHALSDTHRLAMAAHLAPDQPVRMLLQSDMDDDRLLSGAVPQPADWLRAWRVCMNPVSWTQAAQQAETEHYIAQIRTHSVKPKAMQGMVSCMKDALRMKKRTWLSEAQYIFLGFDDKNGRKLLRFKCDAPSAPACLDAAEDSCKKDPTWLHYGARIGVVGCMPVGLRYDLDDYERDYAERTCEEIIKLLQRLCTPAGETLDATFFDDVVRKVAGVVVDGALLKTARYMKEWRFPGIRIIMRDPSHIIRASCRDPLHDADKFAEQYQRLFGQRHAVLKDFMNSSTWQDQLEKAQHELAKTGASTPCLKSVLRHVDFVQPRFESFATPRRRYVCLLRAIAMVLAVKAGDDRQDSGVQRRADAALKVMGQSEDCFIAGLAGDYGEVCLEFLRYFDVRDHDPARTAQQVEDFLQALRQLFVKGYVLCSEGMTEVPGLGQRKTLSQIAVESMEEPLVLTYPVFEVFMCSKAWLPFSTLTIRLSGSLSFSLLSGGLLPSISPCPLCSMLTGTGAVRGVSGARRSIGLTVRRHWLPSVELLKT